MIFENEFCLLRIEDGIFFVHLKLEYYEFSEIDFIIKKRIEMCAGISYPLLVDISKIKGGSRSAKLRLTEKDGQICVSALAVFYKKKFHLTLFSFLVNILYTRIIPFKQKTFDNIETAIKWLNQFKKQPNEQDREVYFKNEHFEIELIKGIITVIWLKNNYDYPEIDFIIRKKIELFGYEEYPVLSDIRNLKSGTKAAINRLKEPDANVGCKADAILCKTKVQKLLFQLYLMQCKRTGERKLFTNKNKAFIWLKNYL